MKLVMVGNGMAGVRTLEELLKIAPDLYDITVFGAEPHPNYNRILLSPGAGRRADAGRDHPQRLVLVRRARHHAARRLKVTEVDRVRRAPCMPPHGAAPRAPEYDRLLLATGSNPFILPVPGKDLDGVIAYRDIADTQAMIDAATKYRTRWSSAAACWAGGGQRPDEARHAGDVVHVMPTADGAPARRRGRQAAAEVAGSSAACVPDGRADPGADLRATTAA
jgi:NAD(P)H-nitrite reductase large subunit